MRDNEKREKIVFYLNISCLSNCMRLNNIFYLKKIQFQSRVQFFFTYLFVCTIVVISKGILFPQTSHRLCSCFQFIMMYEALVVGYTLFLCHNWKMQYCMFEELLISAFKFKSFRVEIKNTCPTVYWNCSITLGYTKSFFKN